MSGVETNRKNQNFVNFDKVTSRGSDVKLFGAKAWRYCRNSNNIKILKFTKLVFIETATVY
jgi:hypothetical protein